MRSRLAARWTRCCTRRCWRRRLGWRKAAEIGECAAQRAITALRHQRVHAAALDADIDLGDGRRVTGTVNRVFDNRIVEVSYSKLTAKHKLQAWISLVALTAANPDRGWTAISVGRGKDDIEVCCFRAPPDP